MAIDFKKVKIDNFGDDIQSAYRQGSSGSFWETLLSGYMAATQAYGQQQQIKQENIKNTQTSIKNRIANAVSEVDYNNPESVAMAKENLDKIGNVKANWELMPEAAEYFETQYNNIRMNQDKYGTYIDLMEDVNRGGEKGQYAPEQFLSSEYGGGGEFAGSRGMDIYKNFDQAEKYYKDKRIELISLGMDDKLTSANLEIIDQKIADLKNLKSFVGDEDSEGGMEITYDELQLFKQGQTLDGLLAASEKRYTTANTQLINNNARIAQIDDMELEDARQDEVNKPSTFNTELAMERSRLKIKNEELRETMDGLYVDIESYRNELYGIVSNTDGNPLVDKVPTKHEPLIGVNPSQEYTSSSEGTKTLMEQGAYQYDPTQEDKFKLTVTKADGKVEEMSYGDMEKKLMSLTLAKNSQFINSSSNKTQHLRDNLYTLQHIDKSDQFWVARSPVVDENTGNQLTNLELYNREANRLGIGKIDARNVEGFYNQYDSSDGDKGTVDYKVQEGDTLSAIANANNVSINDLKKVNPNIDDTDNIAVNAVIKIPSDSQNEGSDKQLSYIEELEQKNFAKSKYNKIVKRLKGALGDFELGANGKNMIEGLMEDGSYKKEDQAKLVQNLKEQGANDTQIKKILQTLYRMQGATISQKKKKKSRSNQTFAQTGAGQRPKEF